MSDEVKNISGLAKIDDAKKAAMGVSALSDTPNRTSRYGTGNLTATELKAWFDKLVGLAIERINEIISVLQENDLASEIPIVGLGNDISTVQALANAVKDGKLWNLLRIAYTDADGNDATMLASAKISAIEAKFLNYVSSVVYDTTDHKIKISKGGSETAEAINTVIVDKAYFDTLIDDYAKLNEETQEITAKSVKVNSVEANSVQADTPEGDKYLVNRLTLETALKKLSDDIETAIATAVSSVYVYKGSVQNFTDLPETGKSIGDVYNVQNPFEINNKKYPADTNVVWGGTNWDALGGSIDTSKFVEKLSGTKLVYTVDGGIGYAESATGGTIPVRDGNGCVKTADPKANEDAATKNYVDTKLETKANIFDFYSDAPFTIGVRKDSGDNGILAVDNKVEFGRKTVPLYDDEGRLSCAEPKVGTDAVNLDYLNSQFSDISDFLGKLVDGGIL